MFKVKFRIKNYRCFGDVPQEFELNEGVTALLGTNNSGKSATLKLFYELRELWHTLQNYSQFDSFVRAGNHRIYFHALNVLDQHEIFNHFTGRPIEIDIIFQNIIFKILINKDGGDIYANFRSFFVDDADITFYGFTSPTMAVLSKEGKGRESFDMAPLFGLFNILGRVVYIPAYRNLINVGGLENYYDVRIGESFIKNWNEWQNGNIKSNNAAIGKVIKNIRDLFGYFELNISASQDSKTIKFTVDEKPYSLEELGSGLPQFVLVFATVALREPVPSFVFIDEPESNLHPSLQIKFINSLGAFASNGIVFSTHSLGLARIANYEYSVVRSANETKIRPFVRTENFAALLGELGFNAYRDIGYDKILLVEGPSDASVFQELLKRWGKDARVVILVLGGSTMINGRNGALLAELTRFGVEICCWIDSEKKSSSSSLEEDRKRFEEECTKLRIKIGISERRAIENYFPEYAIRAVAGGSISALEPYEKLKPEAHWPKANDWKIAMEMKKDDLDGTDLGAFLNSI